MNDKTKLITYSALMCAILIISTLWFKFTLPGTDVLFTTQVLFVLLCMIVRWVFALLVRLLRGVNLIPLVGGANRLLGLVLGLVTGAFDCWLLALLLWFAASITTGQIDWLTTGILQRSVGYSLFGAFNPFLLHY